MGVTFTSAQVRNQLRPELDPVEIELLVDTGALFSVVPAGILDALGVMRIDRQQFTLADGSSVSYDVGEVIFVVNGRARTSQVVFGPEGVTPLLGAFTLESLGLMVNPVTRELLPMRLFLARVA